MYLELSSEVGDISALSSYSRFTRNHEPSSRHSGKYSLLGVHKPACNILNPKPHTLSELPSGLSTLPTGGAADGLGEECSGVLVGDTALNPKHHSEPYTLNPEQLTLHFK